MALEQKETSVMLAELQTFLDDQASILARKRFHIAITVRAGTGPAQSDREKLLFQI